MAVGTCRSIGISAALGKGLPLKVSSFGPTQPPLRTSGVALPFSKDPVPDAYGGSLDPLPGKSLKITPQASPSSLTAMAQTGAATALAPSLGWWGRLTQILGDWVTGRTSRFEQAEGVAQAVQALAEPMRSLSDADLTAKTADFKSRLAAGASLDDIQVEAFAVAREAARRATGLTANPRQILGAALAHQGHVVEMKTGEGKTLMEVMPAYLHALSGKGVHIITANDYLAGRDHQQMGPIFERLGVSSGVVSRDMPLDARQAANRCDITYGTASEFGFQYLNDHLTHEPAERVSRDLSQVFALVDEADKVLLDEANTPLIISHGLAEDPKPARVMATVVKHLKAGADYQKDARTRQAWLTEAGLERVEKILGVGDLYTPKNEELISYLHQAVQAKALYENGVHYLKGAEGIVLIDEFTGRPKPGHRFSEGLHQAIEAAEGLLPGEGQLTLASVTYPNYFCMYGKVAGMTGTGMSASREFEQMYGLGVQAVPTHKPVARKDLPDLLFDSSAARDQALAQQVCEFHQQGRPVLVGTRSVERSEEISALLTQMGIEHQVLNARNLEAEADIIAQAGRLGAVTVATNMAGRGTDIKLGGDPPLQREQVLALGGLAVLGSERHEARRIDDQLAGRAGRQGDPGSSQFFLSREDELFRLQLSKEQRAQGEPHDLVLQAQKRAEDKALDQRQHHVKYAQVENRQRNLVYQARDQVLDGSPLAEEVPEWVTRVVDSFAQRAKSTEPERLQEQVHYLLGNPESTPQLPEKGQAAWFRQQLESALEKQTAQMGEALPSVLGAVYLRSLDREWMEQLQELESLRQGNGWEAALEENQVQYFERKAHQSFSDMLDRVAARTLHGLLAARPMQS
jgi:preprotein translocase subunit SecA